MVDKHVLTLPYLTGSNDVYVINNYRFICNSINPQTSKLCRILSNGEATTIASFDLLIYAAQRLTTDPSVVAL